VRTRASSSGWWIASTAAAGPSRPARLHSTSDDLDLSGLDIDVDAWIGRWPGPRRVAGCLADLSPFFNTFGRRLPGQIRQELDLMIHRLKTRR